MRRIIALTHVSLDGIIQSPGGPEEDPRGGFNLGGWIWPFAGEGQSEAMSEIMAREFDLLLGRRTYEIFAAYWPYAGEENSIARAFNKATKYVVTQTLNSFDWINTEPLSGDAVSDIRRLKESAGPELHIWGSGVLLQALIAADLIDELRLWVYPVILGKGKRLFDKGLPPRGLTMAKSHSTPNGVLLNTYRPTGPFKVSNLHPDKPSEAELSRRKKLADEKAQG